MEGLSSLWAMGWTQTGLKLKTRGKMSCPDSGAWAVLWSLKTKKIEGINVKKQKQTASTFWVSLTQDIQHEKTKTNLPNSASRDWRAKCKVRRLASLPVFSTTSSWPTSHKSNPAHRRKKDFYTTSVQI